MCRFTDQPLGHPAASAAAAAAAAMESCIQVGFGPVRPPWEVGRHRVRAVRVRAARRRQRQTGEAELRGETCRVGAGGVGDW